MLTRENKNKFVNKKGEYSMPKSQTKTYEVAVRDIAPKTIHVIVHPAEDTGGYWAESTTIPGAFTQGDTIQETEKSMYESVGLLLEDDYPEIADYTLEFEVRNA